MVLSLINLHFHKSIESVYNLNEHRNYMKQKQRAFTLIELLIAASILMMVISMSIRIFFNVTRLNTYVELTSALQFEARYLMGRIVREVQGGTIDYPEYYNYYVLQGSGQQFDSGENLGSNYSAYAMRFYNPGMVANALTTQGANTADLSTPPRSPSLNDLGTYCQYGPNPGFVALIDSLSCNPPAGQLPSLEATEDYATGTNPYTSSVFTLPNQASAVCDSTSEMFLYSKRECSFTNPTDMHEVDMLFLIGGDGMTKTIIAPEPWENGADSGTVVSMLKLAGTDTDNDGVPNSWACSSDYYCPQSNNLPEIVSARLADLTADPTETLSSLFQEFAPIFPYKLDITDLRFYIAPIEDPRKAYDEFAQKIQPYVTIIMTATINDPRITELPESQRSITLQATVSSQIYNEILSYNPE